MALTLTRETPFGFTATDAYLRVEGMSLEHDSMSFRVRSYASDEGGLSAFSDEGFDCAYDMEDGNPFTQAYAHLKTLPAFSEAEDV